MPVTTDPSSHWRACARIILGCMLLGVGVGVGTAAASELGDDPAPRVTALPPAQGFALVELFTSEGCASCPPADRLLARLHAEARQHHWPVETLAFHVDYWDDLGWRDPFSSAAGSRRQRWYGQAIEPHSVYTPQMVVNGTMAFVGTHVDHARAAIRAAVAGGGGKGGLDLVVTPAANAADKHGLVIDYRLPPGGLAPGSQLVLTWTQDAARSRPNQGENAGRVLDHASVVRSFRVLGGETSMPAAGRITLTRPGPESGRVVGFVQDSASARVTALVGVAVP